VLEVRDAKKTFDSRQALAGVDLTVRDGEIIALLGPNGAGKTTLVRAICGRVALDAGSVHVGGRNPRMDPGARRVLGLVPQEIALYLDLTVKENLEVLGRLAGVTRGELKNSVRQALSWTGLESRSGDRAGALSGGMKRRLNIAAGTLHRPRLLLLDEPTVGVDPSARETIHRVLEALRDAGMGMLLTTHDLEQAEELADGIAVLNEGRVCAQGTLAGLVEAYFGKGKELTITLAASPDAHARALLEAEPLVATEDESTWTGRIGEGFEALSAFGARLAEAGVGVTEVRVREPGLRGVFFRATGKELQP
jgi:ABC-2 type transport system ATP-binding protein